MKACSTARPSFTSFMIDQTAKEGQLTEEDELNIKGAAILMYSGQLASYGVDDSLNGRLELGGTDTVRSIGLACRSPLDLPATSDEHCPLNSFTRYCPPP